MQTAGHNANGGLRPYGRPTRAHCGPYKYLDKMSDIVFPEEKEEFSFVRALIHVVSILRH